MASEKAIKFAEAMMDYLKEHGCPPTTHDLADVMEKIGRSLKPAPKVGTVVSFMKARHAVVSVKGSVVEIKKLAGGITSVVPISELD